MTQKKLILVSGATGQQGGAVARELLAAGYPVRIMTRNPDSDNAHELVKLGAQVAKADLDDEASLRQALKGAWGAFSVQNTWEAGVEKEEEQGKRFARIAKQEGVQHFVYTSVGSADRNTGVPHFDNKWRVEQEIRKLGFPSYTILRPAFFMENWASPWFKPYVDQGNAAIGIKADTPLQMISVKDIGVYGRLAFERHEELNGRSIDISGDEMTGPDMAKAIGQAKGSAINFYSVPIEQVRDFSADFALMLEWFDNVGYNAEIASNARNFGVQHTKFRDWVRTVQW